MPSTPAFTPGTAYSNGENANATVLNRPITPLNTQVGILSNYQLVTTGNSDQVAVANQHYTYLCNNTTNITIELDLANNYYINKPVLIKKTGTNNATITVTRKTGSTDVIEDLYSAVATPSNASVVIRNANQSVLFIPDNGVWRIGATYRKQIVCALRKSTTQLIGTAFTAVTFGAGTTQIDTANMHDEVTNPSRVNILQTGVYQLQGSVRFADSTTAGRSGCDFFLNGATSIEPQAFNQDDGDASFRRRFAQNANILPLNAGDYVEFRVFQGGLASLNMVNAFFSVTSLL